MVVAAAEMVAAGTAAGVGAAVVEVAAKVAVARAARTAVAAAMGMAELAEEQAVTATVRVAMAEVATGVAVSGAGGRTGMPCTCTTNSGSLSIEALGSTNHCTSASERRSDGCCGRYQVRAERLLAAPAAGPRVAEVP